MSELRLLQAMAGRRPGGAELFFVRLARAFAAAGVAQHLLVREGGHAARLLAAQGVAAESLPFGGLVDLTSRRRFRRAIGEFRPTVVLTWMNRATRFCPRADAATGPFVHAARLGGYYDLRYYRRCDHLIGNTRAIVDYIRAGGFAAGRVHYLPNFADAAPATPAARAALDTPEGVPLLLALGRLHSNKGFDVLLHALREVPGAFLWIAGSGPLEAELKALAARLGVDSRVRFPGWRDDAAALYAAADVFVCSSRHEPLGNVVIEAWAQRTPVVAAASAGPAALLRDGDTGLLVPIEDAPALAAAVRRVLADATLRERLRAAGHAAFEADFTEAAVVARYRDLLGRIAS